MIHGTWCRGAVVARWCVVARGGTWWRAVARGTCCAARATRHVVRAACCVGYSGRGEGMYTTTLVKYI